MPLYKEKALRWKLLEHANDRPILKKKGFFGTFRSVKGWYFIKKLKEQQTSGTKFLKSKIY